MTVSSDISSQTFACDGATTAFTCPFRVLDSSDMQVFLITIATGVVTTLTNVIDYAVTDVDTPSARVTTVAAYGAAYQLKCKRSTARLQETDYRSNDAFPAETFERDLDRGVMIDQEHDDSLARTLRVPDGETMLELSSAANRANRVLAFDASGNPYFLVGVDASSAAALQTDLANAASAVKGPALVAFGPTLAYASGTVGAKLQQSPTVADNSAVGDGATNDSAALTNHIAALAAGSTLRLVPGKTYLLNSAVTVNKQLTIDLNGATIKLAPSFSGSATTLRAFLVTADDVAFRGPGFFANTNAGLTNDNTFIWFTGHRGDVRGCKFSDLPGVGTNVNVAVGFATGADDGIVVGNRFSACPGAAFSQGARPIFAYNWVSEPKDVSFALNSTNCIGGQVFGNNIKNTASTVSGHILAEEGASDWQFVSNYVYGVKNGAGIGEVRVAVTTIVEGGIIAFNTIDGGGMVTVNPSSLITVSNYTKNTQIIGNKLRGMPAGLASNTAIVAPMRGTKVAGNRIDCTTGTTAATACNFKPVGGDLYFFDNEVDCSTGPSRHIVVDAGNNAGAKLHVKGGRMLGGAEGINFNLNAPTNIVLWLESIGECTSAAPVAVSTAYAAFGDRQTYANTYGALGWPHSIKTRTVMYGNAAPAAGTFSTGDEVINMSPTASNPDRWRCVAGGTPGTWKAGANLAA